jgi:hypothetical protein
MGEAMKGAYEKAAQVVAAAMWGFTKDHPVFCAFVALGQGAGDTRGFGPMGN